MRLRQPSRACLTAIMACAMHIYGNWCTDDTTLSPDVPRKPMPSINFTSMVLSQDYIRVEGVKSLSYSATGESLIAGGDSVQALEEEMASRKHSHDGAGCVSLVVKEATERPITEKLVAKNGKLVRHNSQRVLANQRADL